FLDRAPGDIPAARIHPHGGNRHRTAAPLLPDPPPAPSAFRSGPERIEPRFSRSVSDGRLSSVVSSRSPMEALAAGPQQPVEGAPSVPTAISAKEIVSKR